MKATWILGGLTGLFAMACSGTDVDVQSTAAQPAGEDEYEEPVPLEEVPAVVLAAARTAVPGFVPSEAEKEVEEGSLHYCVHGTADGELVEIEVTPAGVVGEIERGADDDEDEGDDADENEEVVSLEEVPAAALAAAKAAVPGFVPTEAEKETEEGSLHYCVHGDANGEFVEVEVTPEGEVLEIERGEDDD